jgi:hypothetical protein
MTEAERLQTVITLWILRPAGIRTTGDVVEFYKELRRLSPELLGENAGSDAYDHLLADVRKYIVNLNVSSACTAYHGAERVLRLGVAPQRAFANAWSFVAESCWRDSLIPVRSQMPS